MHKVLIVEDDPDIINLVQIHLKDLHCETEVATDGEQGFNMAQNSGHDLIILDIMLPRMDGISVCQKLRALDNYTPILMLTAKTEEIDKVLGLESGADDYITKPFSINEFIARVKAILRRQQQNKAENKAEQTIQHGHLRIDTEKRKVTMGEQRIDLTPKEFDLLVLLGSNPGRSYDRDQLLSLVWGYEFNGYEHTVNSHINRLRTKIEPDVVNPKYILTTWGIGYRFNDEM